MKRWGIRLFAVLVAACVVFVGVSFDSGPVGVLAGIVATMTVWRGWEVTS